MKIAYETSRLECRPNLDAMKQPGGYPDQQDPNERNDLDGQSENPNQEAECIEDAGAWHAIQRPWKHTNIEANEQHWNDVQDQDAEQERQHYDTLQASHNQGIDVRTCIGIRDLHIGAMLLDVVFGHLSLETGSRGHPGISTHVTLNRSITSHPALAIFGVLAAVCLSSTISRHGIP